MKEPSKLPPEDWEVKERGDTPTAEIRGDSLTVVNWLNATSKSCLLWHVNDVCFVKNAFACSSETAQIAGNISNNAHLRVNTRTPRNTTLHRSSIHSDNDTDPKHNKTRQSRTHLDQSRYCLLLLVACQWMRPIESFLTNKQTGRGSSWSSLDLETLESDVSSGKSAGAIAKDRGWPRCSVRQRVAAIRRGGDPAPRSVGGVEGRLTPELFDEIREFVEEECVRVDAVAKRHQCSHSFSGKTRALLGEMFRETLSWPALSPDVSPNDYALWRFMGVSRRPRAPNGRHDATCSHHHDPREDHW